MIATLRLMEQIRTRRKEYGYKNDGFVCRSIFSILYAFFLIVSEEVVSRQAE